ncbi:MAG TPA: bifunctional riboflavin kinase/FAD synthetase [Burkholderiales bacterium]|jgi:riboflavin kinase/FMN adenylyltransferase|nr:bifunctional riboflavin kinase/FAD synthetase [Burkholderiales bacterium]
MVVTHGSLQRAPGRCALTIGNLDGVHRGHRALIERVTAKARELELVSCVLTFEPHPREFFDPPAAPARLTRLRDKLELIDAAGVEQVHVARFDRRFASLPAERFVEEVLVNGLATRWLLVGRDFRFGARRAGDFAALAAAGARHGFEVESLPDVQFEGTRVSSSAVRAALAAGELAAGERLLGHPYTISGRVAHGAKLGRSLGFPTANIVLRRPPPLSGIFVVEVDGLGPGVASIGRRPTVNPVPLPLLEVHLFDWERDLYGEHLRVRFLKKLRDEQKYDGLDALREAIAHDARQARDYFVNHG